MTKKELVQVIAENVGINHSEVNQVLKQISNIIIEECKKGGDVTLPEIGKFSSKHRPSRQVRNPQSGETMMSKAKNVPIFRAASKFKAGLN